ncbi:MAG: hypothetical protein ACOCXH_16200 [Cyclobacteriaceae bacterium]
MDKTGNKETPEINLVYEILIKYGFDLNSELNKLALGDSYVYSIQSNALLVATCILDEEMAKELSGLKPGTLICPDSVFNGNESLKSNIKSLLQARGITFKTI